eukprot:TRINITY_DN73458_c0_g1_i1.p1 TRINITY_DN73458_c0_g1~~TRINITY_DN73458_c0_g1_i1.p1  ORF type:complete len:355 (-),score=81.18 TRINITY_DN73458_c0_g1_i1:162-1226(-)
MEPGVPLSLSEAGLCLEYSEDGSRLVVRDQDSTGCAIRNRGGEALARLLHNNRKIRFLDIRESNISDNGIAQLCVTLRETDQLEELLASSVGHCGLEFLLGVVRRCGSLKSLSIDVRDEPTLFAGRQNLANADYDVSNFVAVKGEGDEEEAPGEDEEEAEAKAAAKAEKLRKLFAENDYDSGDETAPAASAEDSSILTGLLDQLVTEVRRHENLTFVQCTGDAVPSDVQLDLARAAEAHQAMQQKKAAESQERGARTASDTLRAQMEEIRHLKTDAQGYSCIEGTLPGEEDQLQSTNIGIRAYVGRHLFDALGDALFECQRFKSKGNEAVSTAEGEMAFIAMYIRRKMAAEAER